MTYVLFVPENIHFILLWSFKFVLCDCQLKKIARLAAFQQQGSFLRPGTINCIICPGGAVCYRSDNSFSDSIHCVAHGSVAVGNGWHRGEGRAAALPQRARCCEERGWVSQPVGSGRQHRAPGAPGSGGGRKTSLPPSPGSALPERPVGLNACPWRGAERGAGSQLCVTARCAVCRGRRQADKWESISLVVSLKFVILSSVIAG